ncbi:PorP/SprF family type IX secretion system membrane protein [Flavobacterium cellulosilyticum]|uniref:Type IX secretion system membrane protein PorP/SprF n=1 Tax=Flavobacterium cellulosilyticum TaxID=2541731 RepID=A0A4R5CJE6_9FLAO|nr:PorP/SprF family type IX secretion system membrane protein [Flavobacterium cellulosilyticum]TDD97494.1 type IX secretion system membrane protein PorP/SprF [Flavobacterium cellulosilyticum]
MKLKLVLYILLTSITCMEVKAQDPVFTQFFLIPESLNPAFTGTLVTGYMGLIHRSQWPNENRRIDTEYAFINAPIGPEREMGLGLTILNQREVFTNYNYVQVNGVYSYNVNLNNEWRLRLGIEAGYGNKSFNFSNLTLEDQINSNTGSISGSSADLLALNYNNKINFFDIYSGILLYNDTSWFGASLKHLNTPNIAFTDNANVPLDMFLSIHSGYSLSLENSNLGLFPDQTNVLLTANYMRQAQYNRLDLGTAIALNPLILGVIAATNLEGKTNNSHVLTSLNLFGTIQLDRFVFGYSYDVSTSKLGNTRGVHELSLTWQIGRECASCDNYLVKKPWGRNY